MNTKYKHEYKVQTRNTKGNTHTNTKAITSTTKSLFGVDLSDVARVCGSWENLWSHLIEF